MPTGRIKKLVFPKAFGLIETPDGKEIFFQCSRSEVGDHKVGDTICYEVVKEAKKRLGVTIKNEKRTRSKKLSEKTRG